MGKGRLWTGIAVSVAWMAFAAWMAWKFSFPEKLNEWGDFFAGFAAPLAFFWLVLGYFQQGDELKQNRDALLLQAKELANSVKHAGEMVQVTRQQAFDDKQAREEERLRLRHAARPVFVLETKNMERHDEVPIFNVSVNNLGEPITGVSLSLGYPLHTTPSPTTWSDLKHNWPRDVRISVVEWPVPKDVEIQYTLEYVDKTAQRGCYGGNAVIRKGKLEFLHGMYLGPMEAVIRRTSFRLGDSGEVEE